MNKDELVQQIGQLLIEDPMISRQPWDHLVIVAHVKDRSVQVKGFAYSGNSDVTPTGPRNFAIIDKFEALNKAMLEPGKESWKACLVRISAEGHISIDFEYDKPEKWLVTPSNIEEMGKTLRTASE